MSQHKIERQQESNFILKALKLKKEHESPEKKPTIEIDDETYLYALRASEYQIEFEVAEETISTKDCIIYPTNKHLVRFNFITCTLVFYDCFMVPFKNTYGSEIFEGKS